NQRAGPGHERPAALGHPRTCRRGERRVHHAGGGETAFQMSAQRRIVVHVTAGVSAITIAWMLGSRRGFPAEVKPPHAPWMVMVGASMLWVGWFGFNAGSALASGADAGMAMLVTHLSAATASLTWTAIEWLRFGRPSLVGLVTGTIAGLATVTPASGYIGPIGGVILGLASGFVCYWGVVFIKRVVKIDDALDVLAVHGFGGALGTILTALLAADFMTGVGLSRSVPEQFWVQIVSVVSAAVWAIVATVILVKITQALVGLRVSEEAELAGLDQSSHGESGYNP
ncbi:MAG: hypothetical protein WD230_07325, partial [Cucumibacter sp.]